MTKPNSEARRRVFAKLRPLDAAVEAARERLKDLERKHAIIEQAGAADVGSEGGRRW